MRYSRILTLLFLAALSFSIFSSGQEEDELKVVTENGIPVAVNPDHPIPTRNNPKDILFKEEFKIGSTEGDPNYIFGAFISFTVDDEGHIYILDWREREVRKFDRQGKYLLTFGGPGQGPGEFSSPEEIRYLPDGQLIIFEGESQRYACFTKEGKLIHTKRFQKLMFSPYFGLTNGCIIAVNVLYQADKTQSILGIFDERGNLMTEFSRTEKITDPPWPKQGNLNARARRLAEAISRAAFRPSHLLAVDSRENIYFASSDRYEIKIFKSDGKLKKIIRTELPFLPLREKDRRAFLDIRLPEDISTWGTMDETFRRKIKNMIKFPENMPAFLSLIPMDENYLMVVRSGYYGQNALIDIFDHSGRFIIEKELSFGINKGICRGEELYTIYKDEEGNRYVKCYSYRFIK